MTISWFIILTFKQNVANIKKPAPRKPFYAKKSYTPHTHYNYFIVYRLNNKKQFNEIQQTDVSGTMATVTVKLL